MPLKSTIAVVAGLLCSTAMIPAAMAQNANPQQAGQAQGCEALAQLIEENSDSLREEWTGEARTAISGGDASQCNELHAQASTALEQAGAGQQTQQTAQDRGAAGTDADQRNADAAARIVVTQPDPQIDVQQQAPQIAVTQPQPQVSVDQGQPEILIRQQSPNVQVAMPQPTVTIDMPQPEIIIRMPDPQVAVSAAQPQVEVRQAEPQVSVDIAEPQVRVQATPNPETTADIEVQQVEPEVSQQMAEGQPQIDVQRAQPKVSYQAAEPKIDVQMMGEPKIQYNTVGEPKVTFQPLEGSQDTAQRQQQPAAGQEADEIQTGSIGTTDQAAQAGSGEAMQQDALALLQQKGEPMEAGQPTAYEVGELNGKTLVNAEGIELGTVDGVVEAGGAQYLVLAENSVLSDGQTRVVLPIEHVSFQDDQLLFRGMTEEELTQLQSYDGSNAQSLAEDEQIELATL